MNIDLPSENAKQYFNRKFTSLKSVIISTSYWKLYICPEGDMEKCGLSCKFGMVSLVGLHFI